MLITNKHLEGACQDQVELFNKTFPVDVEFNKTNWDLALSVGLRVMWMGRFLDKSAWKIYDEAIESAWEIYDEARAPALKIYNEAIVPARKTYNEATESALKIYDEATESARKIYYEAEKSALFDALEQQFNGIK